MRSAMCAASQLSGRGPTDMDVNFFFYITKENKTQTLFSVSFILLHFIAYMTYYSPDSLL